VQKKNWKEEIQKRAGIHSMNHENIVLQFLMLIMISIVVTFSLSSLYYGEQLDEVNRKYDIQIKEISTAALIANTKLEKNCTAKINMCTESMSKEITALGNDFQRLDIQAKEQTREVDALIAGRH